MHKRPTRNSIFLPAVLTILLLLLIVSTRPVLAQSPIPGHANPDRLPDGPEVDSVERQELFTGTVAPLTVGLRGTVDGELTAEDGGRDWYSFEAMGGASYIIELKNTMVFTEITGDGRGGNPSYVPGHLGVVSRQVVDDQKMQVLGEHDYGGFTANFA